MRILLAIALFLGLAVQASAQAEFETKARFAVLMDYESGTVIFQKDADLRLEPASMTKLMTLAVVFNEIRAGRVSLDDEFFVSENAWRTGGASSGGSTMFAELNSQIRVEDLVRSVIIQSGNDAAIVLAEGIAGSEGTFAVMMNELAGQIGLDGSNFTNSTGLPDPNEYSTARDLAEIGRYLIREFPEYYHYFSEPEMEWNGIKQANRNSLVEMGIGVDGLKTGHTEAAGYGSVTSTAQGDRRLVAVVHGLTSMRERTEEARKLLTWGARAFERFTPYAEGQVVAYADVYGGSSPNVALVGKGEIALYLPRGSRQCLSATVSYSAPLLPPVNQGAQVAELRVFCNDQLVQSTPLFAAETVAQGDLVRRATDALKQLALGWL
ncbi:D-alanyl-D-alanine carboxypeptidase (penicillin-binding protein 5/6) [Devosia lucknowensis]|uniref:serine-type D-Ala-D-Ala carboxypeptidase n=1 Tax=Devosia lucknowensis TaxID=1096929 RepID=A0A1Y6EPZ6_9HYPH|nr:D-alanyl-D-alanine carboxypeptidase family protein [Devosia lucknowensis]SMQ64647.1 D-alanyl-D-alanine carboxypeptidase (penicillin-binding protein 5/6) [Devosia lucknowensis]